MKKKKRKIYNSLKTAKAIQRELEIKEHGKELSQRPGKVFKSKKEYKRIKLRKDEIEETI